MQRKTSTLGSKSAWAGEALRRLAQLIVRGSLFDAPLLIALRHQVLRSIFRIERKTLIGARFYFIKPHGFSGGFLIIGRGTKLNHNVEIDYSGGVSIGRDVWISQNVLIETHTHEIHLGPKDKWNITRSSLEIGDEVWIGANAVILPSVGRIGKGAIIGAASVVTKPVPDWAIVAGSPAKILGERPRFDLADGS